MKTNLLFYVSIIVLPSCARYQYGTIESTSLARSDSLEFVIENDSLRLAYNFNGSNAPVNISIQNKLNVPIAIDWHRSALVINDKVMSYIPGEVALQGSFSGTGSNTGASGSVDGSVNVPEELAFVPPQAHVTKSPIKLTQKFLRVPDTVFHKEKQYVAEGVEASIRKARFTAANSPLRFKSYLTVRFGHGLTPPAFYEDSFYVSELITTGRRPVRMWAGSHHPGNQYYSKKFTVTGGILAALCFIGIVTIPLLARF